MSRSKDVIVRDERRKIEACITRKEIEQATEEYLNSGGKITYLPYCKGLRRSGYGYIRHCNPEEPSA